MASTMLHTGSQEKTYDASNIINAPGKIKKYEAKTSAATVWRIFPHGEVQREKRRYSDPSGVFTKPAEFAATDEYGIFQKW